MCDCQKGSAVAPPSTTARARRMFPLVNPDPAGERRDVGPRVAPTPSASAPAPLPVGTETRPNGRWRYGFARDNSGDVPQDYSGRVSRVPAPVRVVVDRMEGFVPTPGTSIRTPSKRDDGLPSCPGDS